MDSESFEERVRRLASERERIAQEEAVVRAEAQQELDHINAEIARLEKKKETLESYLDIDDAGKRMEHGKLRDMCFEILSRYPDGLTSGQIKDIIERESPGFRVGSVPASLSYQTAQGRLKRDERGKYSLA